MTPKTVRRLSAPLVLGVFATLSSLAIFSLALMGCDRGITAAYEVTVDPNDTTGVSVRLSLSGVPRDSLSLVAYAPAGTIRLSEFHLLGAHGGRVIAGADTISTEGRPVIRPRFRLLGPLPSKVTVHYRVRPGVREGDSHIGYTGRCLGFQGGELVFATGRQLFLLPQSHETIKRVEVRFQLPHGWSAETPWTQAGDIWLPGISGRFQSDHLISAAIGLGHFRERSFLLGGTKFRVALESSVPPKDQVEIAGTLERITRYLGRVLGGTRGREYLTVVLPATPGGDEIVGEGWGTGQGGTLHPLTAERVRRYSEQWIGARLRFAPYQSEIRDRDEYWLVDGITSWYSWKAAAVVGLVSENELEREFASSYAQTLHAGGIERNLERMYQSSASRRIPSRILAPIALIQVDRALRCAARATSLDSVLSEMFRGERARSLWQTLPKNDGIDWRKFRADYVQGTLVASINDILPLAPTLLKPSPPRGAPNRKVTLVFTGKTHGYLENCGCKLNQSGGIARRVTALRRIRSQDLGALLFDAGNAFVNVGTRDAPDFLTRKEESFYLKEMEGMHLRRGSGGHDGAGSGNRALSWDDAGHSRALCGKQSHA